jgi:hypothetical protein
MFNNLQQAVNTLRHFERVRGYGDGGPTEDRQVFVKRVTALRDDSSVFLDERGQALMTYAGVSPAAAPR